MMELPPELIQRLTLPDATTLRRALGVVGDQLPRIYQEAVDHQRPRDNANIFGLRVSTHLWAALTEPAIAAKLGGAQVVLRNHAYALKVGKLTIAIHKIGHRENDDIHGSFPEGSDTQKGYGQRNELQMSLFASSLEAPLPAERAYALTELVVGHFGNSETGLAKWYTGAFVYDDDKRPRWAWQQRQPIVAAATDSEPTGDVTAYDQRRPAGYEIPPRRRAATEATSDDTSGA